MNEIAYVTYIWHLSVFLDYSKSTVVHVKCGGHICSGKYANNIKRMYSSANDHIVNCSDFM